MWDGLVTWYESVILLLLFASYFTLLFVNDSIVRVFRRLFSRHEVKPADTPIDVKAGEHFLLEEDTQLSIVLFLSYYDGILFA